jgi:ribosomal protein S6
MAKYEIMVLVNGKLNEEEAKAALSEVLPLIQNETNFKENNMGNRELAYPIKHLTQA